MNVNTPFVAQAPTQNKVLMAALSILLALLSFFVFYFIIKLWPVNANEGGWVKFFGHYYWLESDQRYMILMPLGGALGACIHLIISYTAFVGNRAFVTSWISWYALRPFVGAGLALFFYLLLRGGILTYTPAMDGNSTTAIPPNPDSVKKVIAEANALDTSHKLLSQQTTVITTATQTNITANAKPGDSAAAAKPLSAKDSAALAKTSAAKPLSAKDSLAAKIAAAKKDSIANATAKAMTQKAQTTTGGSSIPLNPYGMLAIACMVGMFSKEAAKKLEETFITLFNVKDTARIQYNDKLQNDKRPGIGGGAVAGAAADTPADNTTTPDDRTAAANTTTTTAASDINDVLNDPDATDDDADNEISPKG